MEFAERMLKKYGWDADKGLGKNNQGMKAALKPVLKFDTRGVGCNQKDEYSSEFKWWEHSYNRAAKKITDGTVDEVKKDKKRKHAEVDSPAKSIYSRFEKGSVLMSDKEESLRTEEDVDAAETQQPTHTDEDLLRICGGRTAHKGARHGIKMSGKLQRLQEQEERSAASHLLSVIEPVLEKKKKEKKRKIPETDE